MGATEVQHPQPKTVLSEFVVHTVYGAVVATIAAYLGDEDLYNGKLPWSAIGAKAQPEETPSNVGVRRIGKYKIQRNYMPSFPY